MIVDATGRTYAANSSSDTVTEYAPGVTGNVSPVAKITGISSPCALALNGTGDLFVASSGGSIDEFAPGANGAATPIATITGQNGPEGLSTDTNGDLYVSENSINTINEYAPGADGNATPISQIAGAATGLSTPESLVVDPTGRLTVANVSNATVTVYAAGATGNATPTQTIHTGLQFPTGVDRGTDLTLFVADLGLNAIVEYPPGASTPSTTISGPHTALADPFSVAATPPLSIITTTLPDALAGTRYLVNLQAGEGTTPYRWRKLRGHLPPGLRITRDGAITGIPHGLQPHAYRFTVQVKDATHPSQRATQALTIKLRRVI